MAEEGNSFIKKYELWHFPTILLNFTALAYRAYTVYCKYS
jgi:hypothetical protein